MKKWMFSFSDEDHYVYYSIGLVEVVKRTNLKSKLKTSAKWSGYRTTVPNSEVYDDETSCRLALKHEIAGALEACEKKQEYLKEMMNEVLAPVTTATKG